MPVAEITAAVTSLNATMQIAKAMVGLRDAETFRAKSIEMQQTILEALDNGIAAREAYAAQLDRTRALEAEVASLKAWNAEKQNYELKPIGHGTVACILEPNARGTKPPHWLCPNCFEKGQKSYLQNTNKIERGRLLVNCIECGLTIPVSTDVAKWPD